MIKQMHMYRFEESVKLADALRALLLSVVATEGLFGRPVQRTDTEHVVNESFNTIFVEAETAVGCVINIIFTAFIKRAFGGAFDVRQVGMFVSGEGGR